jgi:hypothetical protein
MPVDIVLLQLGPWAQGAWTSFLLTNASNAIFDRFVAQDANVTLNGEPIARDAYRELLSLAIDGNNPCKNPEDVNYFQVIEVFGNIYDFVKVSTRLGSNGRDA